MERDGWIVEEAEDGTSVCAIAERTHPAIILLDVQMPGLNGFDVCAHLQTSPVGRHARVMMITGMDDHDSIERAYAVGATDFLSKPVNFRILRQRAQAMYRASRFSEDLQQERDFVSAVVDTAAALVLILDADGRILRFNRTCQKASGYSIEEARGKRMWDCLSSPDSLATDRSMFERLLSDKQTVHYEGEWTAKDGAQRRIAWSNAVLVGAQDAVQHVVCTGLDITEHNKAEEQIRFLASYDALTGLPNRRLMADRIDQAASAAASADSRLAVLFLDLDRFSHINATLGQALGDVVLKSVAERLVKSLRLSDVLARQTDGVRTELGRLGGDEFSVLLTGVSEAATVASIIERLQAALRRPFRIEEKEYSVTASVGAAFYPEDGTGAASLLSNAESAMHSAREEQADSYHFYSTSMRESVADRVRLESELRQAIERNELVVHYQPKVKSDTGQIVGGEALVRWQHPSRGMVLPGMFIGVAEESGLIVKVGEWVMRAVCDQITRWLETGLTPVPIAVNLSSAQFRTDNLLDTIGTILNESSLDPRYLALEVTESMIMRDSVGAREILAHLRNVGVKVAIDDFGTGYSTLSTLKELSVNSLKIDRGFITDIAESPKDLAIVRAVISMAHGLGLTVVAEGVESEEQLVCLCQEECDEVQGFLISPPIPAESFAELFAGGLASLPAENASDSLSLPLVG